MFLVVLLVVLYVPLQVYGKLYKYSCVLVCLAPLEEASLQLEGQRGGAIRRTGALGCSIGARS